MPQYLAKITNNLFSIEGDEARHLTGVMRARVGDTIKIFDGLGRKYDGVLRAAGARTAEGEIVRQTPVRPQKRNLTLCFAPVARTETEEILDKCTQTGVYAFQPIITARTEHDILKKWESKAERWNQIILSAVKQCESAHLPLLRAPIKFNEAIQKYQGYFAYEKEEKNTFNLADLQTQTDIAVFTGPVGGFTMDEVQAAQNAALKTITLGPNIMRAETAAIAATVLLLQ